MGKVKAHAIILACILFAENFIGWVKEALYSAYLNLNHGKTKIVAKDVKREKMMGFVRTFDHYHHKFNFGSLFQISSKSVKEFKC